MITRHVLGFASIVRRPALSRTSLGWLSTKIEDDPELKVLLIDQNGSNQGIQLITDARRSAFDLGLDLVAVNTRANPPVYKVCKKTVKLPEAKPVQTGSPTSQPSQTPSRVKVAKEKEVKMTSRTEPHDFAVKMAMIRKFLLQENSVRILILNKSGRKFQNKVNRSLAPESANALFNKICSDVSDVGRLHGSAKDIGWRLTFMLHPRPKT